MTHIHHAGITGDPTRCTSKTCASVRHSAVRKMHAAAHVGSVSVSKRSVHRILASHYSDNLGVAEAYAHLMIRRYCTHSSVSDGSSDLAFTIHRRSGRRGRSSTSSQSRAGRRSGCGRSRPVQKAPTPPRATAVRRNAGSTSPRRPGPRPSTWPPCPRATRTPVAACSVSTKRCRCMARWHWCRTW